ncbi:hypothetical protein KC360_g3716 [Hortaea werneckii]|nr:hypothetical protein KC325_g1661 [Hortaea werneckii]KAI7001540.1 hypothetical protein KC359_g620 [Hortaea werneckii]KAI7149486.1 hypothetical protein KC344_g1015 [Hortaea werneckii]KAI7175326.1 hypothetical protein KC360_g3716 [Hortaea werneckii]
MAANDYEVYGHLHVEPNKATEVGGTVSYRYPTAEPAGALEGESSRMESVWRREMCHQFKIADRYSHVAAVIIHWADDLDNDLHCANEWKALELDQLFRDDFNFCSQIVVLNIDSKPQAQLNSAISSLILDHDGPSHSNLLIVYYSGHGIGCGENELIVSATRNGKMTVADNIRAHDPQASWNKAERQLDDVDADVLTILDCCEAAHIIQKGIHDRANTHEVLAASGRDTTAYPPGKMSFTRHFIDALKEELEKHRRQPFSTYDLNEVIMRRRKNTSSHVYTRHGKRNGRHIGLAPLDHLRCDDKYCSADMLTRDPRNTATLDLRVVFRTDEMLQEPATKLLAEHLSVAARDSKLNIRAIDWMGYQPSLNAIWLRHCRTTVRFGKRWVRLWRTSRKRKAALETEMDRDRAAKRVAREEHLLPRTPCTSSGRSTPSPSTFAYQSPQT